MIWKGSKQESKDNEISYDLFLFSICIFFSIPNLTDVLTFLTRGLSPDRKLGHEAEQTE